MASFFQHFGYLNQQKFVQRHTKLAKVGAKFAKIVNRTSKIAQDFVDCGMWRNFDKSGLTANSLPSSVTRCWYKK